MSEDCAVSPEQNYAPAMCLRRMLPWSRVYARLEQSFLALRTLPSCSWLGKPIIFFMAAPIIRGICRVRPADRAAEKARPSPPDAPPAEAGAPAGDPFVSPRPSGALSDSNPLLSAFPPPDTIPNQPDHSLRFALCGQYRGL